jgi:hypothetical protein
LYANTSVHAALKVKSTSRRRDPVGERENQSLQLSFNPFLKVDGSRVTSDSGLFLVMDNDKTKEIRRWFLCHPLRATLYSCAQLVVESGGAGSLSYRNVKSSAVLTTACAAFDVKKEIPD